jgi:hypothetical protein
MAIACALLPLAALAADISGSWKTSFDSQIGKQEYSFTFVVTGTTLTGKAKSATSDTAITEGKVDNNTVTFVENLDYQGMPLKVTYTGTIVSADEIKFKRDVAGLAMEELVATRVK